VACRPGPDWSLSASSSGTTWQDGVWFEEVSLGYPEEVNHNPERPRSLRQILPAAPGHQLAQKRIKT
jgi:hypothetical protein